MSKPLTLLLTPLHNWGMIANGKCLTARISASHRIEKECSLSDILEEQVDPKYFLSEKTQARILSYLPSHHELPQIQTELILVKDRHIKK